MSAMKTECTYCGNHQTPHFAHYIFRTVSCLFEPDTSPRVSKSAAYLEALAKIIATPFVFLLRIARVYRWQEDVKLATTGRSRVIWEEAQRRGIPMLQLVVCGKPMEFYCAFVQLRWQYFTSLPNPPWANVTAYRWIDDKFLLKSFFLEHQIPVPKGGKAWSARQALDIFHTLEKPVIIKPRHGSHGRHTSTHIYSEEQCREAFAIASVLCQCVIVEEQLTGSVYRGTYVNGRIVGILRGDPPRVVGDGVSNVRELVVTKNANRLPRVAEVFIDEKCITFLDRQMLTPESVLISGAAIDLSEKIGLAYGGHTAEMIPQTHPALLTALNRAGQLLNVPVVGFDFIIQDVVTDPSAQRWGIIEANAEPFIDLHEKPIDGEGINVAALVWDMWK
jgi:cyanophycin synthetase